MPKSPKFEKVKPTDLRLFKNMMAVGYGPPSGQSTSNRLPFFRGRQPSRYANLQKVVYHPGRPRQEEPQLPGSEKEHAPDPPASNVRSYWLRFSGLVAGFSVSSALFRVPAFQAMPPGTRLRIAAATGAIAGTASTFLSEYPFLQGVSRGIGLGTVHPTGAALYDIAVEEGKRFLREIGHRVEAGLRGEELLSTAPTMRDMHRLIRQYYRSNPGPGPAALPWRRILVK